MGVSTMFGTGRKQFGIWVFLEVQEKNFLGALKLNMSIVYFYLNLFHFTKKFLPFLNMQAFFEIFFPTIPPPTHMIFFYWFLLVDI